MLGSHIERLFEVAGRERCHVVVFDDFISNPGDVYKQVLEFIGVDDDHRREFKASRSNAGVRNRWLQQFAMNPPKWIFRLIDFSICKSCRENLFDEAFVQLTCCYDKRIGFVAGSCYIQIG